VENLDFTKEMVGEVDYQNMAKDEIRTSLGIEIKSKSVVLTEWNFLKTIHVEKAVIWRGKSR
jgi:tRNA U34 5-carboxymethylaminomethyl modifying enzyme MnmG/GidA